MAVEYKDYYQILGVSRTASDDEIRKAFRKLARQYHPDVAKNKAQAEDKFKEINEAYEVLGDAEKRKKYDALGANWKQGGFTPPPGGGYRWQSGNQNGQGGFEFAGTGFSDFFEQFFGSMGGRGGFAGSGGTADREFSERGQDMEADLMVTLEEVLNGSVRPITLRRNVVCTRCNGNGVVRSRSCPSCGGTGTVTKEETYKVKIPPGVKERQRLRIAGQGEAGVGNGPAGDLFLRVRYASHADFRVEDGVLTYDLDLAPWEAALGKNVGVPTLTSPVNIRIPAGTQGSQRLRVRERGLPDAAGRNGDLHVITHIKMPKEMTEKEKVLWEQLARESSFHPRE